MLMLAGFALSLTDRSAARLQQAAMLTFLRPCLLASVMGTVVRKVLYKPPGWEVQGLDDLGHHQLSVNT